MYFLVYNKITGECTARIECNESQIESTRQHYESANVGTFLTDVALNPSGVYFDEEGNLATNKPKKPSKYHRWINRSWQDTRTIQDLKQTKWQEIKSQRSSIESEGFSCYNKVFDSDAISQSRIQGAVQLAQLAISTNQPFLITWTLQDNSTIDLDANQMIEVGIALGLHITNTHTRARELRALIEQANSKEELDLISW